MKIDNAIMNINNLSKDDLSQMIAFCDKTIKQTEDKIKTTNVSFIKLKLANKRDEIKHKRRIFVARFHQI